MSEQSVGVIGVGRLGSDVAFTLAEHDLCDVVLYDLDQERAEYLASDLSDTSFGRSYSRRVSWVSSLRELTGCGVVLIAAGKRIGPDNQIEVLFESNRRIAEEIARAFVGSSTLFVVATEPVDLMTAELARLLKLPPSRVMGIGGVVDAYRVRHAVGEAISVNPDYIRSQVIGPHTRDVEILWDFTTVNGVTIHRLTTDDRLAQIAESLANEADSRLLLMTGSMSRYTPAMASLELVRVLATDNRRVLSVTIPWVDVLGISGVAMSVPCVVGRFGAERPVIPQLSSESVTKLTGIADQWSQVLGAR